MAPPKAAPKGAKPTTKAAQAARSEDDPKAVKWRGLTLELPPKLPGEILFDIGEIEDDRKSIAPILNLVRSIVGQDQFWVIRGKVVSDGLDFEETIELLAGLLDDLLDPYGISAGKSEASAGSS